MYPAVYVANAFVHEARIGRVKKMTCTKLQALLYLAQAQYLRRTGQPLIVESFERWFHGPVCPKVWKMFKVFGNDHITRKAAVPMENPLMVFQDPIKDDVEAQEVIQEIVAQYGETSIITFAKLWRQPTSAWLRNELNTVITLQEIHEDDVAAGFSSEPLQPTGYSDSGLGRLIEAGDKIPPNGVKTPSLGNFQKEELDIFDDLGIDKSKLIEIPESSTFVEAGDMELEIVSSMPASTTNKNSKMIDPLKKGIFKNIPKDFYSK